MLAGQSHVCALTILCLPRTKKHCMALHGRSGQVLQLLVPKRQVSWICITAFTHLQFSCCTKQVSAMCVQEYLGGNSVSECRHCLHKLAVPFFHHEVVKQALLLAIEEQTRQDSLLTLLQQLNASGEIRDSQVSRVSRRVQCDAIT